MLVPTRELGVQVYQVTRQLAQFTSVEVALSVGGLDLGAAATTTVEVGRTGGENDWADEMEEEYYERDRPKQKIVLPMAPRAAIGPDIDDEVEFKICCTISTRL